MHALLLLVCSISAVGQSDAEEVRQGRLRVRDTHARSPRQEEQGREVIVSAHIPCADAFVRRPPAACVPVSVTSFAPTTYDPYSSPDVPALRVWAGCTSPVPGRASCRSGWCLSGLSSRCTSSETTSEGWYPSLVFLDWCSCCFQWFDCFRALLAFSVSVLCCVLRSSLLKGDDA